MDLIHFFKWKLLEVLKIQFQCLIYKILTMVPFPINFCGYTCYGIEKFFTIWVYIAKRQME